MNEPLHLFEGYGIEIESMVVDAETLEILPIVDELLRLSAGSEDWVEDVDDGPIGLSNEFVAHVIELKTNGPAAGWTSLEGDFRSSSERLNARLKKWNAMLLPTAMHPWMNPANESTFWAHDSGQVYSAYHRLFDARRHGWANLQSVHLNLPFANEEEFGRLMAASRLVLALIPALAASSPIVEGAATGILDNRLHFYRTNSDLIGSMSGEVIPEAIFDIETYRAKVFGSIDRELSARGADPILIGNEWSNARGAIARFDRMAIEIRLIDAQECAAADLAIAAAISMLVQGLVEERWSSFQKQCAVPSAELIALLERGITHGPEAALDAPRLAEAFGFERCPASLGAMIHALLPGSLCLPQPLQQALQLILDRGTLSQRILQALGPNFDRQELRELYQELAKCMMQGRSFLP